MKAQIYILFLIFYSKISEISFKNQQLQFRINIKKKISQIKGVKHPAFVIINYIYIINLFKNIKQLINI